MDATTSALVDLTMHCAFEDLHAETVRQCKRRLIDTFACALSARDEPLCHLARRVASRSPGRPAASVWGTDLRATPEAAAFANGTLLRVLDLNDMYGGKSAGHPSDVIAGVLAVADSLHSDGRRTTEAIVLAYEVYCLLADAIELSSKGWDHVFYGAIACAAAGAKLLGLSAAQTGNAISLATVSGMASYQTRRGDISAWKNCAAGNASRNGVFAAVLAAEGMQGPAEAFEGVNGVLSLIGEQPAVGVIRARTVDRITRTHMKRFPLCYHGQSAAEAMLRVRSANADLFSREKVERIEIQTYHAAVRMMGTDRSRWQPDSRETADHSLPYVLAAALVDGDVTTASFLQQRWLRAEVVHLMARVDVVEDLEFTAAYPESSGCRLTVTTSAGTVLRETVQCHKGHVTNPMSDEELEAKFRDGVERGHPTLGSVAHAAAALGALWEFETASDVGDVLVRVFGPSSSV